MDPASDPPAAPAPAPPQPAPPAAGPGEEGGSLAATIGGIVVVAILVVLGYWLIGELDSAAKYEKCVAARHRNCDQINYRN